MTNAQFRPFVEGDGYSNPNYWTEAGWAWREDAEPDLSPLEGMKEDTLAPCLLLLFIYVLQCDIEQSFPSVDLTTLREMLARKLADDATMALVDRKTRVALR